MKRALSILAVDDEAIILLGTTAMLETLGHEVVTANTPDAALELLQGEATFDLLLSDYEMPGKSGAELAMAAQHIHPDLSIILATGRLSIDEVMQPDWISLLKPFSEAQLAAALEAAYRG